MSDLKLHIYASFVRTYMQFHNLLGNRRLESIVGIWQRWKGVSGSFHYDFQSRCSIAKIRTVERCRSLQLKKIRTR